MQRYRDELTIRHFDVDVIAFTSPTNSARLDESPYRLLTTYQPVVEVRFLQNVRNQCEAVTWDRKYSPIESSAPMRGQLVAQ